MQQKQVKILFPSLVYQSSSPSTQEFNSLTHVVTGGGHPGDRKEQRMRRIRGTAERQQHVWQGYRQRERCISPQRNTLSAPWSSMFVTVISVELSPHVGVLDVPVACCLATCAQPCWVAGPWQGVSWYVRSDLCDCSLTCCLPSRHSLERLANHTRYKNSLLPLGKPAVPAYVTAFR